MLNKKVNFKNLERALKSLGFTEYQYKNAFLFKHDKSDAEIILTATVYSRHVAAIKKVIVDKGVLENPEDFDRLMGNYNIQT